MKKFTMSKIMAVIPLFLLFSCVSEKEDNAYLQQIRDDQKRSEEEQKKLDGYKALYGAGDSPGEMVPVPAGKFMMGCVSGDSNCQSDEKPYHEVALDAYSIDKHEVTISEYFACVLAGKCTNPSTGGGCNFGAADRKKHPVNCVDWTQSKSYCEWAGKRLPTEAEWEKAARGTDGRIYPWGNTAATCNYAVMYEGNNGCGKNSTWDVCSKTAGNSPYGACDMAGNVWEWVADFYSDSYYTGSPTSNPKGPGSGQYRVLRGGSWYDNYFDFGTYCGVNRRASCRDFYNPADGYVSLGFRCAR